jgi:hypothetical protein
MHKMGWEKHHPKYRCKDLRVCEVWLSLFRKGYHAWLSSVRRENATLRTRTQFYVPSFWSSVANVIWNNRRSVLNPSDKLCSYASMHAQIKPQQCKTRIGRKKKGQRTSQCFDGLLLHLYRNLALLRNLHSEPAPPVIVPTFTSSCWPNCPLGAASGTVYQP